MANNLEDYLLRIFTREGQKTSLEALSSFASRFQLKNLQTRRQIFLISKLLKDSGRKLGIPLSCIHLGLKYLHRLYEKSTNKNRFRGY